MKTTTTGLALAGLIGTLALTAACASPGQGGTTAANGSPSASAGHKRIAFLGFARANAFATATWSGIEEYARAHDAEAEFLDSNFDAQRQVQQIQDAVTSKRFDILIVQANDGAAVVPAIKQAIAAGITVVSEFSPVGTRYDTADSQVDGMISLVDVPADNGRVLGELGVEACASRNLDPCEVAYLEGFKSLPLDNARTGAAVKALSAAPGVTVAARVEGGYTKESGRKAMQDILQSHPGIDVVIGSSQAIAGAESILGGKDVLLVGNGASRQAVKAVREGRWFATYYLPVKLCGAKAAEFGLARARGQSAPRSTNEVDLAADGPRGTRATLTGLQGEYDD